MRIQRIETRIVHAESRNWVFVLVTTGDGLTGIGEATLEWRARAVAACVEDLAGWIVGLDADPVQVWHEIEARSYYPLGTVQASALSGIDQALWDLAGKRAGRPAWTLLRTFHDSLVAKPASARDRAPAYLNLPNGESEERGWRPEFACVVDAATAARERGWDWVKWKPIPPGWSGVDPSAEEVLAAIETVARVVPKQALDLHGRCEADAALELVRRIPPIREDFEGVIFVEEPCRADDLAGLSRIHDAARIPLATGERLSGRRAFETLIEGALVEVLQPDVIRIGGLTEAVRLAARVAPPDNGGGRRPVSIAPHCAASPVALAASVHLLFAIQPGFVQECFDRDAPWRGEVIAGAPEPEGGVFPAPHAPGLGVALDEAAAQRHPFREVVPPRPTDADGRVLAW